MAATDNTVLERKITRIPELTANMTPKIITAGAAKKGRSKGYVEGVTSHARNLSSQASILISKCNILQPYISWNCFGLYVEIGHYSQVMDSAIDEGA